MPWPRNNNYSLFGEPFTSPLFQPPPHSNLGVGGNPPNPWNSGNYTILPPSLAPSASVQQQPSTTTAPAQPGLLDKIVAMISHPAIQGLIGAGSAMTMTPRWAGPGYAIGAGMMGGNQALMRAQAARAKQQEMIANEEYKRTLTEHQAWLRQPRWQRYTTDTGTEIIEGLYNPLTAERRVVSRTPKNKLLTPRQKAFQGLSKEEQEKILKKETGDDVLTQQAKQAQIDLRNMRIDELKEKLSPETKAKKEMEFLEKSLNNLSKARQNYPSGSAEEQELDKLIKAGMSELQKRQRTMYGITPSAPEPTPDPWYERWAQSIYDFFARNKEKTSEPALKNQPPPPPGGEPGRYKMSDGSIGSWDGEKWLGLSQ